MSGGATLGAVRVAHADCRMEIPDRMAVQVSGVLGAGVFPEYHGEGPPLLPLEHARLRAGPRLCEGSMRVILPAHAPPVRAGARVEITGTWRRSRMASEAGPWPMDGLRAGYLRADSLIAVREPGFAHPFLTLRGVSEAHLQRLFPQHFAMVEALILGRRERLDPVVRDRFSAAGLSHLLAISGSHVAILAAVLMVIGGMVRLPHRRIITGSIVVIALYLVLIGAPASAVRAGAMISLVFLAALLQRPSAKMPIAAGACLFILALEPLAALDVGMQLSFAGVFGIMAAHRTVLRRIRRQTRGKPWHWITETILVSAAAFLATAPVTAYQFGTIAPVSILSNVPAIPLTALALIGIVAATLTSPLTPVANALAAGTGLALDLLDRVAIHAAAVPYGSTNVDRAQLLAWGIATTCGFMIFLWVRRSRAPVRWVVASGVAVTVLIVWPMIVVLPASGLELHFIDVGQGDAVAIRTPKGRWMLVDTGPRSSTFDAGERVIVPFLRARGVGRLEALILTHGDADHIGGAPAVIRSLKVTRIVEPGLALGRDLYLELLESVTAEGAEWLPARDGRMLQIDGVEMVFLWPHQQSVDTTRDPNDASAVALLRYGTFSALLTGDASASVERALLQKHGEDLRATVLKAGHHGSSTSTSAEFLQIVEPELVVISAGKGNRYGHPAPDVLARVQTAGIEVARTDQDGTISLRVKGEPAELQRIGR